MGDLSYLCEDYRCARKAGLPRFDEKFMKSKRLQCHYYAAIRIVPHLPAADKLIVSPKRAERFCCSRLEELINYRSVNELTARQVSA